MPKTSSMPALTWRRPGQKQHQNRVPLTLNETLNFDNIHHLFIPNDYRIGLLCVCMCVRWKIENFRSTTKARKNVFPVLITTSDYSECIPSLTETNRNQIIHSIIQISSYLLLYVVVFHRRRNAPKPNISRFSVVVFVWRTKYFFFSFCFACTRKWCICTLCRRRFCCCR